VSVITSEDEMMDVKERLFRLELIVKPSFGIIKLIMLQLSAFSNTINSFTQEAHHGL